MILRYLRGFMLAAIIVAMLLLAGCASPQLVQSEGDLRWTGATPSRGSHIPVTLILPAGTWEIEQVEPDHVVMFEQTDGPLNITLMRVPAVESEDAHFALTRLLAHFQEKRQLSREEKDLFSGETAHLAEYKVIVDEEPVRVWVSIFRRGEWTYDLVGWNVEKDVFVALVDSVVFGD